MASEEAEPNRQSQASLYSPVCQCRPEAGERQGHARRESDDMQTGRGSSHCEEPRNFSCLCVALGVESTESASAWRKCPAKVKDTGQEASLQSWAGSVAMGRAAGGGGSPILGCGLPVGPTPPPCPVSWPWRAGDHTQGPRAQPDSADPSPANHFTSSMFTTEGNR